MKDQQNQQQHKAPEIYPSNWTQPLFDHMNREHGLILLDSEMNDIVTILSQLLQKDTEEKIPIAWVTGQYERLYDQLKAEPERKIVCWVNYGWGLNGEKKRVLRDICYILGRVMEFRARGIGYGGCEIWVGEENEREEFLKDCNRLNVQWLDEKGGFQ